MKSMLAFVGMDFSIWVALILLFFAGGLIPGPAVMLVTASSLQYSFGAAMFAAIGISVANIVWISLAAVGAGSLATSFPEAFMILKLGGVAFILWLSWSMFRSSKTISIKDQEVPRRRLLFSKGLGLQLANPNALVFFGGMLPAYISVDANIVLQACIIIASITVTELVGLGIYAGAATKLSKSFESTSFAIWFNRAAALVMSGSALFALFLTSQSTS